MISSILKAYGLPLDSKTELLSGGLINKTWKVTDGENQFILQQINHRVFKKPFDIASNIRMVAEYLKEQAPQYVFVAPLTTTDHEDVIHLKDEGYFRLFPFIKGSHTINVASTPEQAYEAAFQFGKFTRLLCGFDATKLHVTIPDFHNLSLRFRQFQDCLKSGNPGRIQQSKPLIDAIDKNTGIVDAFQKIQKNTNVKLRVTHHDTKISNVLFDDTGKGLCVIDLDTVMPGYLISDVGDMLRTYLSPANEEVKDFNAIDVREDFFRAIVQGYVSTMGTELTPEENDLILYSGKFITYMQAMRFLTDYCNNDIYYGVRYEEHNLIRAGNQLRLLQILTDKTEILQKIVSQELK